MRGAIHNFLIRSVSYQALFGMAVACISVQTARGADFTPARTISRLLRYGRHSEYRSRGRSSSWEAIPLQKARHGRIKWNQLISDGDNPSMRKPHRDRRDDIFPYSASPLGLGRRLDPVFHASWWRPAYKRDGTQPLISANHRARQLPARCALCRVIHP